ncbi:MAG TPA: mechanosensitive ion channel domain-containing protein [Candidatus Sulfotelmatobacter sp.]|nr:mechanosensitive ion channel domain-containing protein [Candidatus Sulfotelmatobacter sp.]
MSTRLKTTVFFIVAFLACLLSAQVALAQILPSKPAAPAKTGTDPLGRETPYGTVFGFLEAAQQGNYGIATQYLQLSPARRQTQGETLAMKLNLAMNRAFVGNLRPSRQPDGTPQEDVSPDRQKLGTLVSGHTEVDVELVRVSDPNVGKIWLFSSELLAKIPELYDQIQARGVETRLPAWMVKHELAGMPLWQWLALFLLIPVSAAAGWLLLVVIHIPVRWWARRHGQPALAQWQTVSGAEWLLAGTVVHRIFASYVGMPLLQQHYYFQVTEVAVVVGANWILWRFIQWLLRRVRNRALSRGHAGTGSLMLLAERMVKAAVFVMAVFTIFGILGFNMSTALAGLGIGGLAIGFGAQQTIANLFGGVSVLGDEVIRVGDVCRFGDRTGTVEDIGLRSTRVRTEERTLLAIPNGTVATINVENLSRRDKMLFKTVLALHSNTAPGHVRYVLSEVRQVVSSHDKIEKASVRVSLIELTPASTNVELVCYILTQDFNEFARIREDLLLRIMDFVEESGTTLAFPSQALLLNPDLAADKDKIKTAMKQTAEQNQVGTRNSGKND